MRNCPKPIEKQYVKRRKYREKIKKIEKDRKALKVKNVNRINPLLFLNYQVCKASLLIKMIKILLIKINKIRNNLKKTGIKEFVNKINEKMIKHKINREKIQD